VIITFGSIRGAPGVTSWAALLAAAWPDAHQLGRVLLEADPAGGVLGSRYTFGVDPGAVSLIAALRRSSGEVDVAQHARATAAGVFVIPGPETGEQARAVWNGTCDVVANRLATDDRVWFVDAGRLETGSPVLPFCPASTLTMLLCGPALEDLVQVPARVEWLHARGARVGVMVVGQAAYSQPDLADFFGTGLVWSVRASEDLRQVTGAVLAGRSVGRRMWAWRQASEIATEVFDIAVASLGVVS
jgi:MinD-like ATPase involved in chromosome partitioning or flagellar assembly